MSVRLALGVPAAGKTIALQDMVADACAAGHVAFVTDFAGEWAETDADGLPNQRWRGSPPPIFYAPPPPGEGGEVDLEWFIGVRDAGNAAVLFQYPWEAAQVADVAKKVGGVIYVDDEIDLLAVYSGWPDNPLRDFCHRGRHLPDHEGTPREVHVLGAARRPQNLHTDVTNLADEVLIFRVQGKNTLKRLVEEGMLTDELVAEAKALPNFHYFLWRSTGEIERGVLLDPWAKEER